MHNCLVFNDLKYLSSLVVEARNFVITINRWTIHELSFMIRDLTQVENGS